MDPVNRRWLDELFHAEERCSGSQMLPSSHAVAWYQKPLMSAACPLAVVPDPFGLGQMVRASMWCRCCAQEQKKK